MGPSLAAAEDLLDRYRRALEAHEAMTVEAVEKSPIGDVSPPPEDLELCGREGCRNVTDGGVCSRCRAALH